MSGHRVEVAVKEAALSMRVCRVSVLIRVRGSDDPGSLNPMCPSVPIPRICRSTPPAWRIASSYSAHAAGISAGQAVGALDRSRSKIALETNTLSMTVRYRCG